MTHTDNTVPFPNVTPSGVRPMHLPINYPAQSHTNLLTLPAPYHQSITQPPHNRNVISRHCSHEPNS